MNKKDFDLSLQIIEDYIEDENFETYRNSLDLSTIGGIQFSEIDFGGREDGEGMLDVIIKAFPKKI